MIITKRINKKQLDFLMWVREHHIWSLSQINRRLVKLTIDYNKYPSEGPRVELLNRVRDEFIDDYIKYLNR